MKIKYTNIAVLVTGVVAAFNLFGCAKQPAVNSQLMESKVLEESALLVDSELSPKCELKFDFSYLGEREENDSVVHRINHTSQAISLGREYALLTPMAALDSFKNVYISNYRRDVLPYYKEEVRKGENLDEIPSWYNYTYELTTTFSDGMPGVLNYTSLNYVYQGGAHPNQWESWRNFNARNGKLITLADIVEADNKEPILNLIKAELVKELAKRTENDKLLTFQDLVNEGVVLEPKLFIPENFLLEDEQVSFLYNRYDITPYVMGDIRISIPYSAIKKYLTLDKIQ